MDRCYQIHRLTEEDFGRIGAEWNALLDRSAADGVFLRWEWIHSWWSIFRKNRRLFILTVRQDNRLVGIAPFFIETALFPKPRCLRFCSDELSPDYLDLILEKDQAEILTREIVQEVLKNSGEWDILCLDNLRADSTLLAAGLFDGLDHAAKVSFRCPYLPIHGSFDDYFRSRASLQSFELDKKLKQLFKKPEMRHVMVNDPEALTRAMDELFALRKSRSEAKGSQSNFLDEAVRRFHHDISRRFLAEGILNMQMIYDGEKPVSATYAYNYKKTIYVFQTAFDVQYKKWSTGGLMFLLILRQAFPEGFREFDMLKGDEPYKLKWTDVMRDEMNLTVYGRGWRGQGWRRLRQLKNQLRPVKRALTGRAP
jgi:CelD/BcsL family acetyltransferase involved in cellulose biosynthesis